MDRHLRLALHTAAPQVPADDTGQRIEPHYASREVDRIEIIDTVSADESPTRKSRDLLPFRQRHQGDGPFDAFALRGAGLIDATQRPYLSDADPASHQGV